MDHLARLTELLELESQAEARQVVERIGRMLPAQAETSGYSLVDLIGGSGAGGLGISQLERLITRAGAAFSRPLDVQYRMHELIMNFSSREFYDGSLIAHPFVAGHLLCELSGVVENLWTTDPVTFILERVRVDLARDS